MFRAAGVIGWPAAHSRSPLVHGHWLRQHGLRGAYLRLAVDEAGLAGFVRNIARNGLVGANVTIPHKEAALLLADEADDIAVRLGAANTLWLEDGRLRATNTDMSGFLANLDEGAPSWDTRDGLALVIGAGGAARAIVAGLLHRGCDRVVVANRTLSRAEDLRARFGSAVRPVALDAIAAALPDARVVVNTTSMGMKGQFALDLPWRAARGDTVVTDAVYVPLMTPFLEGAVARGLITVDGLGMLLHQAVPGFAHWFGVRPAVTADLRALIVADLTGAKP